MTNSKRFGGLWWKKIQLQKIKAVTFHFHVQMTTGSSCSLVSIAFDGILLSVCTAGVLGEGSVWFLY
jgi:hypothetical protein